MSEYEQTVQEFLERLADIPNVTVLPIIVIEDEDEDEDEDPTSVKPTTR